ncbi:MAG: SDR family oxidoreductase [Chloroflexi bacterium]|nr:SDR family oxidoreductase [Chloroflexota bacterium]
MTVAIDLNGRTALVTGSSRGLGAAITRKLAQAGANVAVHYVQHRQEAERLVQEIQATGCRAIAVGGDFHDPQAVVDSIRKVQAELAPIDILVNNVGREEQLGKALELSWDAYQAMFDLNVRTAFLASREVVPHLQQQRWGRIINVLSMVIHNYPASMAAYTTAKGALGTFTRSLARELGESNITVNAVSPGWIPVERHGVHTLPARVATAARTPLGHLGEPEDVANVVLFLASDLARFLTGIEIPVCGGITLV